MISSIRPPALGPGGTIAFISPSSRINEEFSTVICRATELLQGRGYQVRVFFTPDVDIQSSITNRHAEIRSVFLDSTISAIICTIGGITFTELLPALIADKELHRAIKLNPKIVVGSSDTTGLHWFLYALTGMRTFYGPSAIPELGTADSLDDASPLAFCIKHLFGAIASTDPIGDIPRSLTYAPSAPAFFRNPSSVEKQEVVPAPAWKWLRKGKGKGRLFGGCLTIVARLNGVSTITPDWRGRIVFLETSLEESKHLPLVQRAVADLIAQEVFEEAAGLVIGRPYGYDSKQRVEEYASVFTALLCEGRLATVKNQFPILMNVDIGHTTPMVTLPYDALAELDSEHDRFLISEAGVV
jgi:muramoyltetrapeptide carboxypeptidase LdcA involved in peptidoglycan recycling